VTVYINAKRGRWCFDFSRNGLRLTGYCLDADGNPVTSRRAASEAEAVEKRKVVEGAKLAQAATYTLAQAFAALTPSWELLAHWPNQQRYINEILNFFGRDTSLAAIDDARVREYVDYCRRQTRKLWIGGPERDPSAAENSRYWKVGATLRSTATVNLYLAALRAALELGTKVRDPITQRPVTISAPAVPHFKKSKRKARPVPDAVCQELAMMLPQHVREAMTVTLLFGFRRAEAFGLTVAQVDFDSFGVRLNAEDVKDDEDAFLPGSREAMAYLARLVEQARARGVLHLITYRPYRKDAKEQEQVAWVTVKRPRTSWARAMKLIEVKYGRRWRWHDLRASFITQVALTSGGMAAQALARHSYFSTTQTYIEVADEQRRRAAARIGKSPALRVIMGAKSQTRVPDGKRSRPTKSRKSLK
jgi:hypothetical protein